MNFTHTKPFTTRRGHAAQFVGWVDDRLVVAVQGPHERAKELVYFNTNGTRYDDDDDPLVNVVQTTLCICDIGGGALRTFELASPETVAPPWYAHAARLGCVTITYSEGGKLTAEVLK